MAAKKKNREKILYIDEKYFKLDVIFNHQNDHVKLPVDKEQITTKE